MTFILATGAKVYGANSYIAPGMVTEYLGTNSGQGSPGGLPASSIDDLWRKSTGTLTKTEREKLEEYCRLATIFFDDKWGGQFNGVKQFEFEGQQAQAVLGLTPFQLATNLLGTLVIGDYTYHYGPSASLTPAQEQSGRDILVNTGQSSIGAEVAGRLTDRINAAQGDEILAEGAGRNTEIENASIILIVRILSESGNYVNLISQGGDSFSILRPFHGGQHAGSQVLEFPRSGLYDSSGRLLTGVPKLVRNLCSEYALRIEAGDLSVPQTPTKDVLVTEETSTVGPISTTRKYAEPTVSPLSVIQRSEFYEFPIHQLLKTSLSGLSSGTVFR